MCILNELLQYAYIFYICDTTDPRVIIIVTTTNDIKNNHFNTGCFSKVVSTPTPEKNILIHFRVYEYFMGECKDQEFGYTNCTIFASLWKR